MQDLVRPGPPDARDQALVAKQRVQPASVGGEDRRERRRVEHVGLGAEVGELGLERVGAQQPDARPLAPTRLR